MRLCINVPIGSGKRRLKKYRYRSNDCCMAKYIAIALVKFNTEKTRDMATSAIPQKLLRYCRNCKFDGVLFACLPGLFAKHCSWSFFLKTKIATAVSPIIVDVCMEF